MFQIRSKSLKDQIKVTIKGDASVQNAGKILQKLTPLLDEGKSIEIDTSDITFTDLSFLQIIGAAYKSLYTRGQTLRFTGNTLSKPVESVVLRTGFFHSKVSTLVPGQESPFYALVNHSEAG